MIIYTPKVTDCSMIVKSQVSSMIVKFESKLSAWITKFNDQSLYHCPQKTKLKTGAKHNQTLNDVGLDVHSVDVFFRSSHVALSQCKVQSSHTALQKNDMWVSIIQKLVLVFIWFWIIGLSTVRVARIKKTCFIQCLAAEVPSFPFSSSWKFLGKEVALARGCYFGTLTN